MSTRTRTCARRARGLPQCSDVGMFLQTVMLLLRAEGLHSCSQMAWATFHKTVAEILPPPDELIRAPLDETVTFKG